MTAMPRSIEAEARHAADRRLHPHADVAAMVRQSVTVTQEEPVSKLTDAAKSTSEGLTAITDAARHLAALAANPLIGQLAEEGLGHGLTPEQVDAVLVVVRGMEGERQLAQTREERNAPDVQA